MKNKGFVLLNFLLIFSSCSFFDALNDYVEKIQFKDSSISLYVGSKGVCQVNFTPEDSLKYYDVEFSVTDDSVCEIVSIYDDYCIVEGLKEGSAIITAELGKKSTRAIINVKAKE